MKEVPIGDLFLLIMFENNKKVPPFISKSELSMMYLAGFAPHSAVNRFMLWLEKNADLMSELIHLGYRKTQKQFNRDQIKVIFQYLDEP